MKRRWMILLTVAGIGWAGCGPQSTGDDDTTPSADVDQDGYSTNQGDCDDLNHTVNPIATEHPYDGIDQDCDGEDLTDLDGDGSDAELVGGDDCDDLDASVHPGVPEVADGVDNDCDGVADNQSQGTSIIDRDRDGYAAEATGGNDCNDQDPSVHPGAVDLAGDGIDSDCDGVDPANDTGIDADGDGYTSTESGGDDPDDTDPDVHPGAFDPPGDGIDSDGDGTDGPGVVKVDRDDDGYASIGTGGGDCNDFDEDIHPGASDYPDNGIDENCDGSDAGDPAPIDNDSDGFDSLATGGLDCNDSDPNTYPGAIDPSGDGIDQDCDGRDGSSGSYVGDGDPPVDQDRDGYVASYAGGNDCNDSDPNIHPGAVDYANDGLDSDCDGIDPTVTTGVDADGDGYTSESSGGDDPDDNDPTVHPGAPDPVGDGIDSDGDGTDGPGSLGYDHDGDGYDSEGTGGPDCDDFHASISPGAVEINNNGVDENCDGLDGGSPVPVDLDRDGYASTGTGGTDCNDSDPTIHPAAYDAEGDCIDRDCSGSDGNGPSTTNGQDLDKDGYYTCASGGNDCNDARADIHPGATDFPYNGIDEDCSGADLVDFDLDGFPSTEVVGGTDCNDNTSVIYPGAVDAPYNGVDEDCSGSDLIDVDRDGYAARAVTGGTDCDDTMGSINPGAYDQPYDGVDQDCINGDEADVDNDGVAAAQVGGSDCNDNDFNIKPGAREIADGQDNDCDALIDEGTSLYDDDGDGLSEVQGDCNDADSNIKPGAAEVVDGRDNDCNGSIDDVEGSPAYTVADGWNYYLEAAYDDARVAFISALTENPFLADGYDGLGWTSYRLRDLAGARYYFDMALALEPELPEALAGRAAVSALLGDWASAIRFAEASLSLLPYPTFRYDLASEERLVATLGLASILVDDLITAQRSLEELDPDHGIDPYAASTWEVGSTDYASYRLTLLKALAALQPTLD